MGDGGCEGHEVRGEGLSCGSAGRLSAKDRGGFARVPGVVDAKVTDDTAVAVADQVDVVGVLQQRMCCGVGDEQVLGFHQGSEPGGVAVDRDPRARRRCDGPCSRLQRGSGEPGAGTRTGPLTVPDGPDALTAPTPSGWSAMTVDQLPTARRKWSASSGSASRPTSSQEPSVKQSLNVANPRG